jgi:phage host-nuclease inhibitor protein Gam
MKLFNKLKISSFQEIQKFSNEKEKRYIETIASLQAEYDTIEDEFNKKLKNSLTQYDLTINNLKAEIDKLKAENSNLKIKNEFR